MPAQEVAKEWKKQRDAIAEMIADWFGRSVIDTDYGLASQILDRIRAMQIRAEQS